MRNALDYAKESFYQKIYDLEISSPEISALLKKEPQEDSQFFELCNHYVKIALNAPRYRVEGTCNVCGVFQEDDIDRAMYATDDYVKQHNIVDFSCLLSVIKKMHEYATTPEDGNKSALIMAESGGFGMYYNFAQIPDDIWVDISEKILLYLE